MSEGSSPHSRAPFTSLRHNLYFTSVLQKTLQPSQKSFTDPAHMMWVKEAELLHDLKPEKLLFGTELTLQLPYCAARRPPPKYREITQGCQIKATLVPQGCLSSRFNTEKKNLLFLGNIYNRMLFKSVHFNYYYCDLLFVYLFKIQKARLLFDFIGFLYSSEFITIKRFKEYYSYIKRGVAFKLGLSCI